MWAFFAFREDLLKGSRWRWQYLYRFLHLLPFGFHAWWLCFNPCEIHFLLQLSAMDVSVRSAMKGAAKCDKHCELQNSVNRQGLERILCCRHYWQHACFSVYALHSSQFAVELVSSVGCELLGFRKCVGALETFNASGFAVWASLLNFRFLVLLLFCIRFTAFCCSDMKLGWQTRWI